MDGPGPSHDCGGFIELCLFAPGRRYCRGAIEIGLQKLELATFTIGFGQFPASSGQFVFGRGERRTKIAPLCPHLIGIGTEPEKIAIDGPSQALLLAAERLLKGDDRR